MLRARISEADNWSTLRTSYVYILYTSSVCKGLRFCGEYSTKIECKRAIKRMGVKLGQAIEVIE